MIVFPHGIHVDRDGNIWVTDGQDNFPAAPARRRAPTPPPPPPPPAKPIGHQIFKFSPDGKVLLTLGKPGGNRPGQPRRSVVVLSAERRHHERPRRDLRVRGPRRQRGGPARCRSSTGPGKFIKETGTRGNGPGEFIQPHALAFDSKGRLFVADRSNNRIQIYDQDLNLLDTGWEQYSRISGLWIDKNDMLYAADSESGSVDPGARRLEARHPDRQHPGRQGRQDPVLHSGSVHRDHAARCAAEGVAVDAAGNIYGAEVGPARRCKKIRRMKD